jgi:hypothetical protein
LTTEFDSKTELDFRNRLIAKFAIPRAATFWGQGFDQIPETALFPRGDRILDLCKQLRHELKDELQPGDVGDFIKEWADLEHYLLGTGRRITERNLSVREAISVLAKRGIISRDLAMQIQSIRKIRNSLVHRPSAIQSNKLGSWLDDLRQISQKIQRDHF